MVPRDPPCEQGVSTKKVKKEKGLFSTVEYLFLNIYDKYDIISRDVIVSNQLNQYCLKNRDKTIENVNLL